MRPNRPVPLDASRDFRINEMFFSTTDPKGVIRSGNDVFVRVSAYTRDELLGHAHSIIRHPDMPRAVFRLVWDHLKRELPVAGLIKNLAKDGRYYWVVALLLPIKGGYLSIRFKPSTPLLAAVEAVYREMLAAEAAQADGRAGMDAADKRLLEALRAKGFGDYDAFMRTLLHEELKSRDATLVREGRRLFPETLPEGTADDVRMAMLRALYAASGKAYEQINTLYAQLDEFAGLNLKLAEKSEVVLTMTQDFRFIAFNAALRSARLGEEGRALGVIAEYLSGAAAQTAGTVAGLTHHIEAISGRLRAVIFNLAAARLQIEMVMSFCAELAGHGLDGQAAETAGAGAERHRMIEDLQLAFAETIDRAVRALIELEKDLCSLGTRADDMRRLVLTLQVAQVGGLVEASRLTDDDSFVVMFSDLRERVDATKAQLGELGGVSERLGMLADQTPAIAQVISRAVTEMGAAVAGLSGAANSAPVAPAGGAAKQKTPAVEAAAEVAVSALAG